jgi:hypothetical protein
LVPLQLLTGNTDTTTPVYRPLEPPIIASKIRFVPFSIYARTMCMRVELFGCDNKRKTVMVALLHRVSPNHTTLSL